MASASSSSLSVRKPCTSSEVSLPRAAMSRRKSCDTVCSSNASCFLQKRKAPHPLSNPIRGYATRSGGPAVRQRVLSARMLKLRSVQSELNDANFHLSELAKENKALRTLQKRQDKALLGYEGVNADLPRLIKSHEEQIRVLRERNKTLRRGLKEAAEQLKIKEEELSHAREQLKNLSVLTKDKNLGERQKLTNQLEDANEKLDKTETQINLLNRRLMLETKNYKFRLNAETCKHKVTQKDLSQAIKEIARLVELVDIKDRYPSNTQKRRSNIPKRQSISLVSLGTTNRPSSESTPELLDDEAMKLKPLDLKLERRKDSDTVLGTFTPPSETIKARLSAKASPVVEEVAEDVVEDMSAQLGTLDISETDLREIHQKSIFTVTEKRPKSSARLRKIPKRKNRTEEKLLDSCSQVFKAAEGYEKTATKHQDDFEVAKSETEKLLSTLRKTDEADCKTRKQLLADVDLPEKDLDIINKIWNDEYQFQKLNNKAPSARTAKALELLSKSADKNGNITREETALENKKKLLATLRAIDNGDSIEEVVVENESKKTNIMNELFGDLK